MSGILWISIHPPITGPGPNDRFLDPISPLAVRFLPFSLAVTKVFHNFVATMGYRYQ